MVPTPYPGYFTKSLSYAPQLRMNAYCLGFEFQIQFVPSDTHPIEPCRGALLRCSAKARGFGLRQALPANRTTAHSGPSLVKHQGRPGVRVFSQNFER